MASMSKLTNSHLGKRGGMFKIPGCTVPRKKRLTLVLSEKQFAEAEISTGKTSLETLYPQTLC